MYEVINKLCIRAKVGDEEAKILLIDKLSPLIKSSIKKYCPLWDYYEDLYQDGVLILLECLKIHDEKKGTYLNFLKNYLRFYYLETFKYLLKDHGTKVPLEDEEKSYLEELQDDFSIEDYFLSLELSESLKAALGDLTLRQRKVVLLFYYNKLSLDEIAAKLNISKWTVVNTKRRAVEILKRTLAYK
ncbi:RNA polymerase sigma factor [Anaerosphaera multitolerans]|uniref:Sigma-70 family RNA polymerase sigma factor n=1 Tax=Anaerosphaera multitolerans TaxID=2487351 RepID=A0A437S891_9FIRM|nr:sigma-70 family RNA polymerase sigma factor [Anaerosphaera multitolerans]RVU55047.1 sigma-70 family RNA polymerase sigma factor [Anaerosphaera multitolerans]